MPSLTTINSQCHLNRVDIPIMSAVITMVSLLMDPDYVSEAPRKMETLGLSKHNAK